MKHLILIIVSIFLFANSNAQTLEQNIQEIRTQFKFVNSQKDFKKVYLENEEFADEVPSEGCGLDAYYKNGQVYKIIESDAVSTAVYTTEYYLKDNKLIFVYRKEQHFSLNPETGHYSNLETTYEERVYYKDGKIIRHLKKGSPVSDENIDYKKLFNDYLKYINTKIKYEKQFNLLQGTWTNTDDIDDWFEVRGMSGEQYNRSDYINTFRLWFDGQYLWFHNTTPGAEDVKYKISELSENKLKMQNTSDGEVFSYEKNK